MSIGVSFFYQKGPALNENSSARNNKSIKAAFRCIINKINSQAEKNVFGNGEDELHVRTSGPIRTSVLMLASITQYEPEHLMNYFEREMNNCELSLLLHRPNIALSEKIELRLWFYHHGAFLSNNHLSEV